MNKMKFVSKSTNLHIILRPGLPSQPLTGTPETPRISVKFEGGIVEVKDENLVQMMLQHPGFGQDFFSAEPGEVDPYAYLRKDNEPAHTITEMQFGHPVARVQGKQQTQLTPEIRQLLQKEAATLATDMVKQMLPEAVNAALADLAAQVKATEPQKAPEKPVEANNEPESTPAPAPEDAPASEPEKAPESDKPAAPQAPRGKNGK